MRQSSTSCGRRRQSESASNNLKVIYRTLFLWPLESVSIRNIKTINFLYANPAIEDLDPIPAKRWTTPWTAHQSVAGHI